MVGLLLQAQDWDYYTPLKASGEVPAEFTDIYATKYQRGVETISEEDSRKNQKRKDDFYKKSEYFVDEYLVSGKVFYGDTVTRYCQSVLDHIIGDNQELREKVRVYTVKSSIVNATATANGIIFINLGLLAQLETEAQLAYILSHELVHYTENHVLSQYIEREQILNNEAAYRRTDDDEKMLALSTYSKSQELEADEKGYLQFFSSLPYNQKAPNEVLDILQYAYLPFDEVPFPKDFLETDYLVFPDDYFLDEIAPITAEADYDDAESTHPNLSKRKTALQSFLPENNNGLNYLVSETAFAYCRKLARFEIARLHLVERKYSLAIYHSFLLLRKYPGNRYLRLSIAKALQGLLVYSNDGNLYEVTEKEKNIEGESQQVHHFFNHLSKDELATLAVTYSYNLKQDYPDDPAIDRVYDKCLSELVWRNELELSDFKRKLPDTTFSDSTSAPAPDYRANSKVGKIQRRRKEKISNEKFYTLAFIPFMEDSVFVNSFEEKMARKPDQEGRSFSNRYEKRSKYDRNAALGINRAIGVSPQYLKLDQRDKDGIKFISTDERLQTYRSEMEAMARKVKLDMVMLDHKGTRAFDEQSFNDLALLNSWLSERIEHVNHEVLNSDFDYVEDIIERYNTPFLINSGNVSLRVEENTPGTILLMLILPYYAPFGIIDLCTADYESLNYFFVFDLRNGDALLADYNHYQSNDARDYIRSILYNHFLQVSSQPKN